MTEEVSDKLVMSIVGNLGDPAKGDPQISLHCSVDRDGKASEWNDVLDRMTASFERQSARAEITRIEAHIRACERTIADTYAGDKNRVDDYNRKRAAINEQIEKAQSQIPAITAGDEAKWQQSGRPGPYKPSNEATSRISRQKNEAAKLHASLMELDLEKSEGMKKIERVVDSQKSQIVYAHAEIARLTAIIEGKPPTRLAAE